MHVSDQFAGRHVVPLHGTHEFDGLRPFRGLHVWPALALAGGYVFKRPRLEDSLRVALGPRPPRPSPGYSAPE